MTDRSSLFVLGSFVVACSAQVGRFPQTGESALARHFVVEAGGKGFNLATGAHRLGAIVTSIFAVGDDLFGEIAAPAFAKAGFAPTRLRRCAGQTGSGIAFIDATGETCLAIYPGANLALAADDVQAVAGDIANARAVLAQFEIADAPIRAAFAIGRRAGAVTILNPSPFRMPEAGILRDTSVLVVNEVEALALAAALGRPAAFDGGHLAPATVTAILAQGPHTLVVTRGTHGAVAYRHDTPPLVQPAFAVAAIDSLGAGDAFLAAFAVGLAGDLPFAACLRQGAAAGALATLRPGVFDALATDAALRKFLDDRHDEAHPSNDDR